MDRATRRLRPLLPSNIGKVKTIETIHGKPRRIKVLDEIRHTQSSNPDKAFYLQRLRLENEGREEFRFGYYIIGVKPRMRGKWAWGQSAPMVPAEDFQAVIREAAARGWIRI